MCGKVVLTGEWAKSYDKFVEWHSINLGEFVEWRKSLFYY